MGWKLQRFDGEDLDAPPAVGDRVYVIFLPRPAGEGPLRGERMWVEVAERSDDGVMSGRLLNTPVVIDGIQAGEIVHFRDEHVVEVRSD